ncbi:MAG TPA: hypothetical protein VFK13_08325 [Gemmatimonadaceae bacterium]|nr:hypothetical protein [Gemmatimonadaceae bacterium]
MTPLRNRDTPRARSAAIVGAVVFLLVASGARTLRAQDSTGRRRDSVRDSAAGDVVHVTRANPAGVTHHGLTTRVLEVHGDSAVVQAGTGYTPGWFRVFLFGNGYRDLWPLPVTVKLLDFDEYAGGLTATEEGGGHQTVGLHFRGADGREYRFRSVDKNATGSLDSTLHHTVVSHIFGDQISTMFPMAPVILTPLLDAAGVMHPHPVARVIPDDPRLGAFRDSMRWVLGTIEEKPDEGAHDTRGFGNSTKVVDSDKMLERVEDSASNRVDAPAFLRARLMDVYVGDWDRHPEQWRWAAYRDGVRTRWEPIPTDRDWAFSRMGGVGGALARRVFPNYTYFRDEYPGILHATWSGRALDRRLLSELPESTFVRVAEDLRARLTDSVIDAAVSRMPPAYEQRVGEEFRRALRARRDAMVTMARDFYRMLAGWVDVHATDEADLAVVTRVDDSHVRVELYAPEPQPEATARVGDGGPENDADDPPSGVPYFARTFTRGETHEVRIYLHGGDDRAVVRGRGHSGIEVHIVGGGSDDVLDDRADGESGRTFLHDGRGENRFLTAGGTHVDRTEWTQPLDSATLSHQAPARDWGSHWSPVPVLAVGHNLGVYVGAGLVRHGYGFRYYPWKTRFLVQGGYATGTGALRGDAEYLFPLAGRKVYGRLYGFASRGDVTRFYGFGNRTRNVGDDLFYRTQQQEYRLETMVRLLPTRTLSIDVGPTLRTYRPYETAGTLLDSLAPYGSGTFDETGMVARLEWDRTPPTALPTRGGSVTLEGRVFPSLLDVRSAFGGALLSGVLYRALPLPTEPVLALRAGGEKVWGDAPFRESAFLGGSHSVRGYHTQRFAGDASVFLDTELRVPVARAKIVIPMDVGVLGLYDMGRVFVDGVSPGPWHSSAGGGLWFALPNHSRVATLSLARSVEQTSIYARLKFAF